MTDRFITGPTADLPIAIYTPAGDGPFPAVIYFHGSAVRNLRGTPFTDDPTYRPVPPANPFHPHHP